MSDSTKQLSTLSQDERRALETRLLKKQATLKKERSIPRRTSTGPIPLSFAQQRLWYLDQLEPNSPFYNMFKAVRLSGNLDTTALQGALETIATRHESLRTTFKTVDGEPLQIIAEKPDTKLQIIDLESHPVAARESEAKRLLQAEARTPFDLKFGPLFRSLLLRLGPQEHLLLLTIHHIVCDGWSMSVLMRELTQLYVTFCKGKPSSLTELVVQYGDYAIWQRGFLQGETLSKQIAYWKGKLAGLPVMEMPTDYARPPMQTYHGQSQPVRIGKSVVDGLQTVAQQERVTLFMLLLAAFQTLLHHYTGQDDIVVGSPLAGRNRSEIEDLIGFFITTRVLRTDASGDPPFREFLRRVRDVCLEADAHQNVPFEKLVEELQPPRDPSRTPLFQITFQLQNLPRENLDLAGLHLQPVEFTSEIAKFDLSLGLSDGPDGLRGGFLYNTDLFEAATIQRLAGHLQTLVAGIAANPDARLSELPLLTCDERQQLVQGWNDTKVDYAQPACLHHWFEEMAAKTPDAVAVVFEGQTVSYHELNRRANRLAYHLRELGVGPDVLVGICAERSIEMVVGLYGILKAGGAYVPMDPEYPKDRLAFMLEDASVPVLLTQQHLGPVLPPHKARVVFLDSPLPDVDCDLDRNPRRAVEPDNLAYMIYTSGSTGRPKGAMNTHRAICNHMLWMQAAYQLTPADRVVQKTPFSFDVSVFEFFWPLMYGARLVVAKPGGHREPSYLVNLVREQQITTLHFVPSMLQFFLEEPNSEACASLRRVICSGEALPFELQERFFARSQAELHNLYGPTEAAVHVTYLACERGGDRRLVPIGRPIANIQMYVLDRQLRPVPIGIAGELYIAGVGLARGYHHRPDLTAEKFVPDPLSSEPNARMYKTGDLARLLPDGNIDYLGRIDHQVKLRGFRIELGEIESLITQHPGVRECVVIMREDAPGRQRLVAYFVSQLEPAPAVAELRASLQTQLPEYMVPALFVRLEQMPLSPNGKIDRKALPAPDASHDVGEDFLAPRNALELELKNIWEEVLDMKPIGIRDNFFEIGGHSLLAVKLFAKVEQVTGKKLPLATLFQAPTIEQFAEVLHRENWTPAWNALVAIQPAGTKTPLFLVHGVGGNILNYQPLAKLMAPDQPVYAMQSVGMDGKQPPLKSVEEMATAYIQEMRALQPCGPYYLGGMSFGGMVIWEMAQQLTAQGEQIGLLAMLDVSPWGAKERLGRVEMFQLMASSLFYRIRYNLIAFLSVPWSEKIIYIRKKKKTIKRRLKSRQWQREYMQMLRDGHTLPPGIQNVKEANFMAVEQYEPQPYEGMVTVFRGSDKAFDLGIDPRIGWRHLALGGVTLHEVPGDHLTLVEEPHVRVLVEKLRACLEVPTELVERPRISIAQASHPRCQGRHEPGRTTTVCELEESANSLAGLLINRDGGEKQLRR